MANQAGQEDVTTVRTDYRREDAFKDIPSHVPFAAFDEEGLSSSIPVQLRTNPTLNLKATVFRAGTETFAQPQAAKEIEEHRAVAEKVLGREAAGDSVLDFIQKNSKVIPLDPWATQTMYKTGSNNPLTMDYVMLLAPKLQPTTKDPCIVNHSSRLVIPLKSLNGVVLVGEWCVGSLPPEPEEGKVLQMAEKMCWGLSVRYTAPVRS
ncbi:unnamed protein product [Peniophora sp. CBMAI 1063]|nr:unnamed protein product [Peniophora sp. CBMAI 1063]